MRVLASPGLAGGLDGGRKTDANGVSGVLRGLYHEDADVLLSTVHRAKGLEWDRVTVLYPELMPSPHGDPEEERCVLFVALTRSKDTLRLAYGKESWANGWRLKPADLPQAVPHEEEVVWHAEPLLPLTPSSDVVQKGGRAEVVSRQASAEHVPQPPRRQTSGVRPEDLAAHAQRVREATRTVKLEDGRPLALFNGSDVMQVSLLWERLEALVEEPRPALQEWAQGSLTLLRSVTGKRVHLDLGVLTLVERAANQVRLAVPLLQALDAKQVPVVVFAESFARLRVGQVTRRGDRVWSVTVEGQALRFDPRTGELLGEGFTPRAVHLRWKAS